MTVRRNAENKFVRYCTRLQTDDLGAAIGKITHDAMLGEAAAVVIDFACRVPFDPEVLSALAHARGLRTDGFQHIEVGKCEETFNSKLKMLQFSMKQRCQGTRRRTARKQATLPPCKRRYPVIAGGRVLSQASQASDDRVARYAALLPCGAPISGKC
jgi:hypothetical protein